MDFDAKIAIVLDEQLAVWQKANVTAFLISGIAATDPALVGDPYFDGSGDRYLPMCRQPIMVHVADGPALRRAYERAMARDVERLAVFTHDFFATPHDHANRGAIAARAAVEFNFAGIALHADRKTVDKVLDRPDLIPVTSPEPRGIVWVRQVGCKMVTSTKEVDVTTTVTPSQTLSERVDRLVRSHSDSWPPLHSAAPPVAIAEIIEHINGLEEAIHAMALEIQRLAAEGIEPETHAMDD